MESLPRSSQLAKPIEVPQDAKRTPGSISISGFMLKKKNLGISKATQIGPSQTKSITDNRIRGSQTLSASKTDAAPAQTASGAKILPAIREDVVCSRQEKLGVHEPQQTTHSISSAASRQPLSTVSKNWASLNPIFDDTMSQVEAQKRAESQRIRRELSRQAARAHRPQTISSASVLLNEPEGTHTIAAVDTMPSVENTPINTETRFVLVNHDPGSSFDTNVGDSIDGGSIAIENIAEENTEATVERFVAELEQLTVPANEEHPQKPNDPHPDEFWRAICMIFVAGFWLLVALSMFLEFWIFLPGIGMLKNTVKFVGPYLGIGLTATGRGVKALVGSFMKDTARPPLRSKLTPYEFKKCKLADRYSKEEYPGFKQGIRQSTHFSEADIHLLLLNTNGDTRIDREGPTAFCSRLEENRRAVNNCADVGDFLLLLQRCIALHDFFDTWQDNNASSSSGDSQSSLPHYTQVFDSLMFN